MYLGAVIEDRHMKLLRMLSRGRVTIPAEFRRRLGIRPRDLLVVESVEDTIVMRRIRDFFDFEGFLGRAASPEEEERAIEEAAVRHALGLDD
jgi:AbrB family looped-hinge helix DNA binding protein